MSRPCRDCGEPIDWEKIDGRNVPVIPGTKNDHREVCLAKRGQVREGLRRPQGHHLSASRIKRHEECPQAFYLESILRLPGATSDDMDAGKLAHDALEGVLVERARSGRLAEPVTAEELHAALEVATLRQPWTGETLAHVREVLAKAAPRLDLSFAERDEHGPLVERAWTHPVGEGVLVGGIWDLVERIGDVVVVRDWKTGGFREPSPSSLPAVGLYAAAARARWPGLEVRVVLSYLALGEEDEIAGHALDAAVGNAVALARALALKARAKREDESAWPGVYGPHCSRCPFTARCETFKARSGAALVAADARAWRPVESLTLEEVAAELHTLAAPANVLESRVKALRKRGLELAKPIAETDPWGRVQAGVWPLRVKAITRKAEAAPRAGGTYHQLEVGEPLAPAITEQAAPALPAPGGCAEHGPAAVETSPEGTAHCRVCEARARAVVGVGITVGSPVETPRQVEAAPSPEPSPKAKRARKPRAPNAADAALAQIATAKAEGAKAEGATPAEPPSALAAVAAGPGVQALAEPLRALGAAAVIAEPLAPAPYLAPGSRPVYVTCPRGCGAPAIHERDGTFGPCETCLETDLVEAQAAEDRAQAEREDAEERAAIRQADGLAPDGTGPGLPLGPGGARPW